MQTYKRRSTKAFCGFATYKPLLFLQYGKNSRLVMLFLSNKYGIHNADVRSTTFVTWRNWPIGFRKTEIALSLTTFWKFASRKRPLLEHFGTSGLYFKV